MKKSWRIVPPLALATTLHAMVLSGVVRWHGGEAGGSDPRIDSAARSVSVRVAAIAAVASPPDLPAPVAEALASPRATPDDTPPPPTEPAQAPRLAPLPRPEAPPLAVIPQASETPAAEAPADGPIAPQADRYLARRELSRPPKPLKPIDIVFPPGVPTPGRHAAILAIYIDEQGHVRKVRTEGEALPLAFEDAARNAFLSAPFRAGELDGRAVKSYIHVEVVFDEQPEARGLAASALGMTAR